LSGPSAPSATPTGTWATATSLVANAEICWLGRRGRPQRKSRGVRQLIVTPIREHSRKPDEVYSRIEALSEGPYLDLFARERRPNWICWGDELDKFYAEGSS
jgi:N6-adenosine-specific RNA methylase IME4